MLTPREVRGEGAHQTVSLPCIHRLRLCACLSVSPAGGGSGDQGRGSGRRGSLGSGGLRAVGRVGGRWCILWPRSLGRLVFPFSIASFRLAFRLYSFLFRSFSSPQVQFSSPSSLFLSPSMHTLHITQVNTHLRPITQRHHITASLGGCDSITQREASNLTQSHGTAI